MSTRERNNRGGKRKGAGRKEGKAAFVNVKKKEETKVMRVPKSKVEAVKELIKSGNEMNLS